MFLQSAGERRLPEEGRRHDRITVDPEKMGGTPCIRGMRMPVATVVGMVAEGMTTGDILGDHPDLEAEDIRQALRFAAHAVDYREIPMVSH
ncbi:MAG: DUF433 domain-containing protein [Rhodospirillales bacterium]|nr:DUF433 domain-containing protein [Rhodospirillales bacterium]